MLRRRGERRADGLDESHAIQRFLEVLRAVVERELRKMFFLPPGDQYDWQVGTLDAYLLQQLDAAHARHSNIRNQAIDLPNVA